jgi:uncharacterized protein YyaL (SSP411 family)
LPASPERRHADTARGIVGWLVREMQADDGAFYWPRRDSEGHEGKFYVWTRSGARRDDGRGGRSPHFGLDQPPNFEGVRGTCALPNRSTTSLRVAISLPDAQTRLAGAKAALFAARATRVRPDATTRSRRRGTRRHRRAARAARALESPDGRPGARRRRCAQTNRMADRRLLATRRGDRSDLNAHPMTTHFAGCAHRVAADALSARRSNGQQSSRMRCSPASRTASAAALHEP